MQVLDGGEEWGSWSRAAAPSSSVLGRKSGFEKTGEAVSNEMPHPQLRGFCLPLHLEYLTLTVLAYIWY